MVVGGGLHDVEDGIDPLVVAHSAEEEAVEARQQDDRAGPACSASTTASVFGLALNSSSRMSQERLHLSRVADGSARG